jgi:steroid delta-isomerase-like uncharacterized protein
MSSHDSKETVRRFYDALNSDNLDEVDRYLASDIVDHNPFPGQEPGLEGLKKLRRQVSSGLSDYRVEVHDMIAEGDKVAARVTYLGRHTGELQGFPPTGKEVSISATDMFRLSGGKIVDWWSNWDQFGFLTQLGAIPETGEFGRRAA